MDISFRSLLESISFNDLDDMPGGAISVGTITATGNCQLGDALSNIHGINIAPQAGQTLTIRSNQTGFEDELIIFDGTWAIRTISGDDGLQGMQFEQNTSGLVQIAHADYSWKSAGDMFIDSDSSVLGFGAASPATPDATIGFDGDSLNIVANVVNATDDLNLTAQTLNINADTQLGANGITGFAGTFGNITISGASITSSTGAISFNNENLSSTGTLNFPEIFNSAGNLKIMPDIQGDVDFFGDTDVGNATDGKALFVHRKASEGDSYVKIYNSQFLSSAPHVVASGSLPLVIGNENDGTFLVGGNGSQSTLLASFNDMVFGWQRGSSGEQAIIFQGNQVGGGGVQEYFRVQGHTATAEAIFSVSLLLDSDTNFAHLLTVGTNTLTESGIEFNTGFSRGSADTSATLTIVRNFSTDVLMGAGVVGDDFRRFVFEASGKMFWGSGALARDTNLYRSAANKLTTDDELRVGLNLTCGGDLAVGTSTSARTFGNDKDITIQGGSNPALVINDTGQGSVYHLVAQGDQIDLRYGSTALMLWENSGRIGIGTVTPTTQFSVKEKGGMTPIGGFVIKLTNKTGSNSVAGQLVIAHTTINDAVALSGANELMVIGVFLDGGVSDGSEAWIVINGIADVAYDNASAIVRGDRISSGLAGLAMSNNTPSAAVHFQEIGHSIESVAASGTARCVLHFN